METERSPSDPGRKASANLQGSKTRTFLFYVRQDWTSFNQGGEVQAFLYESQEDEMGKAVPWLSLTALSDARPCFFNEQQNTELTCLE